VSRYPSNLSLFSDFIVYYCCNCGVGFVPGVSKIIEKYYFEEYAKNTMPDRYLDPHEFFNRISDHAIKKIAPPKQYLRAQAHINLLKKHNVNFDVGLDVGSGPGFLLKKSNAKRMFAIEADKNSKKYLDYINATILNISELPNNFFDFIVSSHFFEHLTCENIFLYINSILRSLKKNGTFLVEVPQGGHSYLELDTRQDPHTIFFTPESLLKTFQQVLKNHNCQIVEYLSRATSKVLLSSNPIYKPDKKNIFFGIQTGALVIVIKKIDL
jgi:ubiquinone/menaquinone biosynthesis C-methylase UbiE